MLRKKAAQIIQDFVSAYAESDDDELKLSAPNIPKKLELLPIFDQNGKEI